MPHKTWAAGEDVLAADFNPNIANQICAQYANAGARTTGWPSPPVGALSVLDSALGLVWIYTGTQWVRSDWQSAWGAVGFASTSAASANGSGNTPTDFPGMSVAWTAVSGRRYRTAFHGHTYSSVVNDVQWFTLCDSANAVKNAVNAVNNANAFAETVDFYTYEAAIAAGAVTRKIRFYPPAGGGIMNAFADASRPSTLLVEDVGPTGPPTLLLGADLEREILAALDLPADLEALDLARLDLEALDLPDRKA